MSEPILSILARPIGPRPKIISVKTAATLSTVLNMIKYENTQIICKTWQGPYLQSRIPAVNEQNAPIEPQITNSTFRENATAWHLINRYVELYGELPRVVLVITDRNNESFNVIEKLCGVQISIARIVTDADIAIISDRYREIDLLVSFVRDTAAKMSRNLELLAALNSVTMYGHPQGVVPILAERVEVFYPPFAHVRDEYLYLVGCSKFIRRDYTMETLKNALAFHRGAQLSLYVYFNELTNTMQPSIPNCPGYSVEFLLHEAKKLPGEYGKMYREVVARMLGIV